MISSGLCFFAGIRRPFLDPDCHSRWTTQKGAAQGLRQEHDDIRSTLISPGVVATELGHDITDPAVATALVGWRKKALSPNAIARAIRYAVEQPEGVDINEVMVRPTAADM